MSIEQSTVVDAIGVEKTTGHVVLTAIDHLDWQTGEAKHLEMLQEKLNTYLKFIESGELSEKYPTAKGRQPVICIVARCEPTTEAFRFLSNAKQTIEQAGFGFRFEKSTEESPCVS